MEKHFQLKRPIIHSRPRRQPARNFVLALQDAETETLHQTITPAWFEPSNPKHHSLRTLKEATNYNLAHNAALSRAPKARRIEGFVMLAAPQHGQW